MYKVTRTWLVFATLQSLGHLRLSCPGLHRARLAGQANGGQQLATQLIFVAAVNRAQNRILRAIILRWIFVVAVLPQHPFLSGKVMRPLL